MHSINYICIQSSTPPCPNLIQVTTYKGCTNPATVRETSTITFSSEDNCYTGSARGSFDHLSYRDRQSIWKSLGVRGRARQTARVAVLEKTQTCLCYGITDEEDAMTKYQKIMGYL